MLHVDIPTLSELRTLAAARGDICASLYLPTTPLTQDTAAGRIALKNLVQGLVGELDAKGFDKRRVAALEEQLADLVDDDEFWRFQARSLAVLATPDSVRSYRLPNRLSAGAEIADRFHLKPLLRAVTFPHEAFVLVLSQNAVRVVRSARICRPPRSGWPTSHGMPRARRAGPQCGIVRRAAASRARRDRRSCSGSMRGGSTTPCGRSSPAVRRPCCSPRSSP
jgi:hypothetical protein